MFILLYCVFYIICLACILFVCGIVAMFYLIFYVGVAMGVVAIGIWKLSKFAIKKVFNLPR